MVCGSWSCTAGPGDTAPVVAPSALCPAGSGGTRAGVGTADVFWGQNVFEGLRLLCSAVNLELQKTGLLFTD